MSELSFLLHELYNPDINVSNDANVQPTVVDLMVVLIRILNYNYITFVGLNQCAIQDIKL